MFRILAVDHPMDDDKGEVPIHEKTGLQASDMGKKTTSGGDKNEWPNKLRCCLWRSSGQAPW